MSSLSFQDVYTLNGAIRRLYAAPTLEAFSSAITEAIRSLMAGEICCVNWVNRGSKIAAATVWHPAAPVSEEVNLLAQTLLATQTPFWLRSAQVPRAASDSMSRTEWARKDIHWACRQVDKEEFICFDVPLTSNLMLVLAEMRGRYGMYSPAERLKLQLLGPHLPQIYERLTAQTGMTLDGHRNLRVLHAEVSASGLKCTWPEGARQLLTTYGLVAQGEQLPEPIRDWFLAQRRGLEQPSEVSHKVTPLVFRREHREIAIFMIRGHEPDSYQLLLREREAGPNHGWIGAEFGLSPRESEVLSWVVQGKSNPEIALLLDISPGTVRRHLENIFPKLGVENRYAAALMFLKHREIPGS